MPRFRKEWLVGQAESRVSSASLVVVAYAGNMTGAERELLCQSLGRVRSTRLSVWAGGAWTPSRYISSARGGSGVPFI